MNEEKCVHNNICIDEVKDDMIGTCEACGEIISINHIKSGLYVIDYNSKLYLLNTLVDMDLENTPYHFELDGNNICLGKNLNNDYKNGTARQLCKKMGN